MDIDRVLNSEQYFEQNRYHLAEIGDSGVLIDSEAIARLDTILEVVILDDHDLLCTREDPLNSNDCLIQTDGKLGLTDEDVQQLVNHFRSSPDSDYNPLDSDA